MIMAQMGFIQKNLIQTKQLHQLQLLLLCDFPLAGSLLAVPCSRGLAQAFTTSWSKRIFPPAKKSSSSPCCGAEQLHPCRGSHCLQCFHETLLPLRSSHSKVPLPMAGGWNSMSFKVPSNPNPSGTLCGLCGCRMPITGAGCLPQHSWLWEFR